ncbi:MAG: NAD-dependent epimerase/dehydratase family protein [Proteobacteria bacterium]|nr:NAD-dependent epimerase/dehydratase family protein [Pseudomonadota bacterium]MBI3498705.1 NAD-dependent epimerase/dehydratase family protein [Pseudomonadota bacterium]
MTVLLTGAAGFIGYHVAMALLARGDSVVGIDNLNPYYDPALKRARLARLEGQPGFAFHEMSIADRLTFGAFAAIRRDVNQVVHLAAQAGVRHSLEQPFDYADANLQGHLAVLELSRRLPRLDHLVYASSSSVYGANDKLPFSTKDRTDRPISLYGATKKAGEMMTASYSHLYRLKATGLRFFTVYGPWGRPDMSAWLFTRAILEGRPIPVFNRGDMRRDFTYIDDIVAGVLAALDRPPEDDGKEPPHRLYNLGNSRSEELLRFIQLIEAAVGRQAILDHRPIQPGDVKDTFADIKASRRDLGFEPKTTIDDGVPRFVAWYRDYHRL